MRFDFDARTKEKLIELGIKYLIERAHLADFPMPQNNIPQKKRKWSPQQRRKFLATMKAKNAK